MGPKWIAIVLIVLSCNLCFSKLVLSNTQRQVLLKGHNSLRSSLPKAANILMMQWDYELENMASLQASSCVYARNDALGIGSNIAATHSDSPDEVLQIWREQGKNFDLSSPSPTSQDYAQMLWAGTFGVGCSYSECRPLEGRSETYFWVCNYATGAGDSQQPHLIGRPCKVCPGTHPECVHNMCSPGLADQGDFGAMVFPLDEGSHFNGTTKTKRSNITSKFFEPSLSDIPGTCPDDRVSVNIQIKRGIFDATANMKVVVGLTIGTQVSYTNMVFATALKEASFDGSRHLFSCVPLTSNLTLWVFDCSDHEECGGPWGVPGTLSPSYSSTLSTWSSLAEDKDVFIKGEHNDPRYLVMSYTKSSGETSKVG
eukprot:TRINITY_DN7310_c0_g1_i54.p1 TRINITY_DN7310_c0_g1~~TRINITY_DN7310_c0_g1_i54.p1  ORF type:complete len:370 (-),score=54.24 TRINITY_DN7310_c0_g1_i54:308-1417(-)